MVMLESFTRSFKLGVNIMTEINDRLIDLIYEFKRNGPHIISVII